MARSVHPSPYARRLVIGAIATLGVTAAHHVYGGVRYATPWRIHGAVFALAVAAVLLALFAAYRRAAGPPGRRAGWALAILAVLVPVLATGVFEGFYNHLIKDLLFVVGLPHGAWLRLFPPSAYVLPDDAWFELTGIAQVIPAAVTAVAAVRLLSELRGRGEHDRRPPHADRIAASTQLPARTLEALSGDAVEIPDLARLVHLQFRRFAGCPVCGLHLRSIVLRHGELVGAGIREVVVFHSTSAELRAHAAGLPFAVIADPDKQLYRAFGVASAPRALLDPRAWSAIARAVLRSAVAIVRGRERGPAANPHGGRLGLPADFLIDHDGRVVACKYGAHVYDQWSVDEILALAARSRGQPRPPGGYDRGGLSGPAGAGSSAGSSGGVVAVGGATAVPSGKLR